MLVNLESMVVLPSEFVPGFACVGVYPAASNVTARFEYKFSGVEVTSYSVQDEVGTGASVQVAFEYAKSALLDIGSTTSTTSTTVKPTRVTAPKSA
jgi:putative aminopeptidase FrvX